MSSFFKSVGGRKMAVVVLALLLGALNKKLGLELSVEEIQVLVYGAVGGAGAIAFEDAFKALFSKKEKPDA